MGPKVGVEARAVEECAVIIVVVAVPMDENGTDIYLTVHSTEQI
jgi:hypothetical protein